MACYMYEENISALTGYSFLGVEASPHLPPGSLDDALGRKNDERMLRFREELGVYFKSYLHGTSGEE